jgi:hypothetical protein
VKRLDVCKQLVEDIRFHKERLAFMWCELARLRSAHFDPDKWEYVLGPHGKWDVAPKEGEGQLWS